MLITVEPKLVVDTLLCSKFLKLCSHIIYSVMQGKWLVLNFFGAFTGLESNIGCQILGGGGGLQPPGSYAPVYNIHVT